MRILHIITRLILGGAQENTLLSCIGQQERGHVVRLLVGPTAGAEGSLVAEARAHGVEMVEIPSLVRQISPGRDLKAFFDLRREIRGFRPDVVHTHSSKAGVVGRWAAWRENQRCARVVAAGEGSAHNGNQQAFIVHTIHGLPFHPYQPRLSYILYREAERWAAKRCHRLLSVAEAMTRQAVAAGVAPADKFETVYSGMRLEPFLREDYDVAAIRQRWGLTGEHIVIGKVARLFELKGHDFLLPVFARLAAKEPRLRLVLVGDGEWRSRLERLAQTLGIAERVVFAGLLAHDRIAAALAAMDIVVHCSLREGLPRVLPQALLAGKPAIAFDVDGAAEALDHGATGVLVKPGDMEALATAIVWTLANMPEARQRALLGRERCCQRFDWRHMVARLIEIYAEGLKEVRMAKESAYGHQRPQGSIDSSRRT